MPPRHTYWTIILEGKPTAFRARTREELMPTLRQLQSRHPDAVLRWFARGHLWESPEQQRASGSQRRGGEWRGPGWRPGGAHQDPRERFRVPRDEKRRRFADKARRERLKTRDSSPHGRRPPGSHATSDRFGHRHPKPGRPDDLRRGWERDGRAGRPSDWRPKWMRKPAARPPLDQRPDSRRESREEQPPEAQRPGLKEDRRPPHGERRGRQTNQDRRGGRGGRRSG